MNNGEYVNFLRRFRAILLPGTSGSGPDVPGGVNVKNTPEAAAVPAIGLKKEQVESLDSYIDQISDLNSQSRILHETAARKRIDHDRMNYVSFVLTRIQNPARNIIGEKHEAGVRLLNIVKPYLKLSKLPNNQRTEAITGMLIDLRKPENAAAVALLDLEPYMNDLEALNSSYEEQTKLMSISRVTITTDSCAVVRKKCDSLIDDITDQVFAWSITSPSDEATNAIVHINSLIVEMRNAHKQRMASGKTAEGDSEELPDV